MSKGSIRKDEHAYLGIPFIKSRPHVEAPSSLTMERRKGAKHASNEMRR